MTGPEAEDVPTPVELIADLNRIVGPDGIQEDHVVELGGVPQVVSLRGRDRTNPVLLCVHGGPGAPLSPSSWMWQRPLEDFFTVVQHDQRAAGRTHALTPADEVRSSLTIERYVDDLLALAEWLVDHLGVERIALLGHSWGSVLATTAVARRPELFSVYVGVGQVVRFDEGERASWRSVLEEARRREDEPAVMELEGLAPYPGPAGDGSDVPRRVAAERAWVTRYGGFAAYRDACDYFAYGELTTGWTAAELQSSVEASALQGELVLPQLRGVDLTGIDRLDVPVVQVLGRHDLMTPTEPVLPWLDALEAPSIVTLWFERSAHLAMYEETGRFVVAMHQHVRPHADAHRGHG